jgi:hypothetical protein
VRDVKIVGTVKLKDGTSVTIGDEDIVQGSLYINKRCVSQNDIDFGTVYASEMGMSLYYDKNDNVYKYNGAYFDLKFGLKIGEDSSGNDLYEYVPLGIFKTSEIKRSSDSVNIICLDDITKFDKDIDSSYAESAHPPNAWISYACSYCGVTQGFEDLDDFPNSNVSLSLPSDSNTTYTCRDVLAYVLQAIGAFGYIDRNGKFQVRAFHSSIDAYSYPNDRFSGELSDYEVTLTGFKVTTSKSVDVTVGKTGYMLDFSSNPFLNSKDTTSLGNLLNNLLTEFSSLTYGICDIVENGDPALDVGDTIRFYSNPQDSKFLSHMTHDDMAEYTHDELAKLKQTPTSDEEYYGTYANIIAMNITWYYRGSTTVNSYGQESSLRKEYDSTAQLAQTILKVTNDIVNLNLQDEYLNSCIGGYVLLRLDSSKRNEILIMDNPDPDKAVKIWRWNLNGLGYSNNCTGADNSERTYNIAITMDGVISADFIKTGVLTSADGTLTINLNKGAAEIIGKITADSGKIGNWNISTNEIYSARTSSGTTRYTSLKRNGDVAFGAYSTASDDLTAAKLQIRHNGDLWSNDTSSRTVMNEGGLSIYGSGKLTDELSDRTKVARINNQGILFYREKDSESKYLGFIGTNKTTDGDLGIVFDLSGGGDYMSWGMRKDESSTYTRIFYYDKTSKFRFEDSIKFNGSDFTISNGNTADIYRNIDMHNWDINNVDINTTSDARLKENISPSDVNALDVINSMQAVQFDWIESGEHEDLGFIAQQLNEVNPDFVGYATKGDDEINTIKLLKVIPYLIKAVQELSEKVDESNKAEKWLLEKLKLNLPTSVVEKVTEDYERFKTFIKKSSKGERTDVNE